MMNADLTAAGALCIGVELIHVVVDARAGAAVLIVSLVFMNI